jgi:AraC-like DNA-binding protein
MLHRRAGRERINIGEVAYRCGFANQSHFSASYKMRYGVTPTRSAAQKEI